MTDPVTRHAAEPAGPLALPPVKDLELLARSMPAPLVVSTADGDGRILVASDAAARLMRVDPKLATTLRTVDFYANPDDRARLVERLRRDGAVTDLEIELRRQDGTRLWVLVSGRLVSHDGAPMVLTVFQDITDRRNAEATVSRLLAERERANAELEIRVAERTRDLRASEQRFRDVITASGDWVWETGPDHRLTWLSPRVREVFNIEPEALIGKSRVELAADAGEADKWRMHLQVLERRQSFRNFTYAARLGDDSVRHLRLSGVPVFDEQQRFVGYRGTGSDITGEVQTRRALEQTSGILQGTFEHMGQGLVVFGPDHRLVAFTPRYVSLLEIPVEMLRIGDTHLLEILEYLARRGDYGPVDDADVERIVADRLTQLATIGAYRREGQTLSGRWLLVNGNSTAAGGVIVTITEITAEKRAEAAANEARQQLVDALESIHEGFALYDAADRLVMYNSRYRDHFEINRAALEVGRTFEELIRADAEAGLVPEAKGRTEEWVAERLAEHRALARKLDARPDDRWVTITESRTRAGGTVVIFTDVTDLRRAEAAATQARQQLLDALEAISEGFVLFDADDRLVLRNSRAIEKLAVAPEAWQPGATFEEIVRAQARARLIPEALGREEEWVRERIAGHRALRRNVTWGLTDGTWITVNEYRTRDGGTVNIYTDVTELRRAERSATEAGQRLLDALESINVGFVLFDADDRLVLYNVRYRDHFEQLPQRLQLGVSYEQMLRNYLAAGMITEPAGSGEEWVAERLAQHRALRRDYPVYRTDGRWMTINEHRTRAGGTVMIFTDISELKQAEAEAQHARQRLVDALEAINDGFVLYDAADRLVMFNARYRDHFDMNPANLQIGLTFQELVRADVRDGHAPQAAGREEEWIGTWVARHQALRKDFLLEQVDGRSVIVNEYRTKDGGIVVTYSDITRLRAAEREATEARQRLIEALEAMSEGFVLFDAADRLVLSNRRWREHFAVSSHTWQLGWSYEQIIRAEGAAGLMPADAGPLDDWVAERVRAHRALRRDFTWRTPNAAWETVNEYRTKEGGTVGIYTDVSALKHREQALEENRRLLRAVIDAVPAVINVKDCDSRYVLMNRFQGTVYGVTPEEAIGRTSADLVGASYGDESRALDQRVIETGAALPFTERRFIDVRGDPHTWFAAKLPLKNDAGQVQNVVTVALDITALKATERARANLARYFAPNLVDVLAAADEPFGPARSQTVAVLFCDIVGFTRMCAGMAPDAAFALLREFHNRMAELVFQHAGTLDKYLGDGLMATFGTPQPSPRDAANALACARAMLATTDELSRHHDTGDSPIELAIGLHWGPALLGNTGNERRLEFAVIGDTVNLASRLEELARSLQAQLVASDAIVGAARAQSAEPAELAGLVVGQPQQVRGIRDPVPVWLLRRVARG